MKEGSKEVRKEGSYRKEGRKKKKTKNEGREDEGKEGRTK